MQKQTTAKARWLGCVLSHPSQKGAMDGAPERLWRFEKEADSSASLRNGKGEGCGMTMQESEERGCFYSAEGSRMMSSMFGLGMSAGA